MKLTQGKNKGKWGWRQQQAGSSGGRNVSNGSQQGRQQQLHVRQRAEAAGTNGQRPTWPSGALQTCGPQANVVAVQATANRPLAAWPTSHVAKLVHNSLQYPKSKLWCTGALLLLCACSNKMAWLCMCKQCCSCSCTRAYLCTGATCMPYISTRLGTPLMVGGAAIAIAIDGGGAYCFCCC